MVIGDGFLSDEVEEEEKEETPKYGLFDYVNDILYRKSNLLEKVMRENGDIFPAEISSFMLLKTMFNYRDTALLANEMNTRYNIPIEYQYKFYYNAVPQMKRFCKWNKVDKTREDNIETLSKYFHWSKLESEKNLKMFNDDELKEMNDLLNKEGAGKIKRK